MNKVKTLKLNIITSVLPWILLAVIGFVKISLFIDAYGSELNGFIQLISQIYGYISLVEMGFGSAITFRLYKPLAEKNKEEVARLFNGSMKIYRRIALQMAGIGIIVSAVLPFVLQYETLSKAKIVFVFVLYVLDYFLKYIFDLPCRILLYADQKRYKANLIVNICTLVVKAVELALIFTRINYLIILSVIILLNALSYVLLYLITKKEYPWLRDTKEIDTTTREMSKDVMAHKVSRIVFYGTDNIIISTTKGLGLAMASIYGSYNYIISAIRNIIDLFLASPLEMLGNRFAKKEQDTEANFELYQEFIKATYFIGIMVASVFFIAIEKLIAIWIDRSYILNTFTVLIFAVYLWYECIGRANLTMIEANGKYKETKKIEIICAITNIVLSFILVRVLGVAGVVLATVVALALVRHPMQTNFIYKNLFNKSFKKAIKEFLIYTLVLALCLTLNVLVTNVCNLYSSYTALNWIISTFVIGVIDALVVFTPMYLLDKSFKNAVKRFLSKK